MDYEVLQFTYINEIFIVSWLRLIHYSVISKDILPIKSSFVLAILCQISSNWFQIRSIFAFCGFIWNWVKGSRAKSEVVEKLFLLEQIRNWIFDRNRDRN